MECCILSALKCWSVPYVANGEGLPDFCQRTKIHKIHRLDRGVKLGSRRAVALQSLAPTHKPCSFLVSWIRCLIRVVSKLCRALALQQLSLTHPWTRILST